MNFVRLTQVLSLGLSAALLVAACSAPPDSPTSVRVIADFNPKVTLTQLTLESTDHQTTLPSEPTLLKPGASVLLLLDDTVVGTPLELSVWGLAQGEKVAYGSASATPVLHQVTDVHVDLAQLPCGAGCSGGATACGGDGVKTCQPRDSDACYEWSEPVPCPKEAPYCSLGQCAATCVNECSPGSARCAGEGHLERCGQTDADTCLDWLATEACPTGTTCEAGVCKAGACANECQAGTTQCSGAGLATCGQFDTDACLEWGPPAVCPQGQFCSNGACSAACQDECSDSVCDGLVWKQCDQYDLDPCKELSAGTSCAPADACFEGACNATAGCSAAPLVCAMPPTTMCVDSGTLRVYQPMGTCTNGTCDYPPQDIACPNCPACDACAGVTCTTPPTPTACYTATGTCASGSCSYAYANGALCDDGNPCTTGDTCASGSCAGQAKVCATPPAALCSSATTLRTYAGPGACAAGTCTYGYTDTECASGCSNGMCNGVVSSATAIALRDYHTCALTSSGGVKCWGNNGNGQLGNNSTVKSVVPVDVLGLPSGVTAIGSGYTHTCALTSSGGVKCWGSNTYGELGNNSTVESHVPVDVQGLPSGVTAIALGTDQTCALTSSGGVKCWGRNDSGQLGNNTTIQSLVPVGVLGLSSGVTAIGSGYSHICALTSSGGVKCWGVNDDGQLGNNSTVESHVPVNVLGLPSGVTAIESGHYHTCALTSSGGVKCWGYNGDGQLGNNSTANGYVPVDVQGLLSGVTSIALGREHTCALTSSGGVTCWGRNNSGQLGNNSTVNSLVPVGVQGLPSGVTAIALGGYHTCALTSSGGVTCWGYNNYGQLGNNTTIESHVPVDVFGF